MGDSINRRSISNPFMLQLRPPKGHGKTVKERLYSRVAFPHTIGDQSKKLCCVVVCTLNC
jgi:hypothetical protein